MSVLCSLNLLANFLSFIMGKYIPVLPRIISRIYNHQTTILLHRAAKKYIPPHVSKITMPFEGIT